MSTIVLTGGGTAGHIIPHIALLRYIEKDFDKIYYIGAANSMEERIISAHKNITFVPIETCKLIRKFTLSNLKIPFILAKGILQAKRILKKVKPDVIFSKGGYVALPVVLAAHNIPVISHESDITLGLANKIMAHKCKVMCTNFESTAKLLSSGVFTGAPIRHELYNGNKHNVINLYKLSPEKSTILIMGGSLGSVNINKKIRAILPDLLKKFNIIHIVGKGNIDSTLTQSRYVQIEFTNNISDIFAAADIIVSRAGATAIHEFLALRKPMLLIPLSKAASRGDQILNAQNFNQRKIANVLLEEDMSPESLKEAILNLYSSRLTLIKNMSKEQNSDGTQKIYEQIIKYVK